MIKFPKFHVHTVLNQFWDKINILEVQRYLRNKTYTLDFQIYITPQLLERFSETLISFIQVAGLKQTCFRQMGPGWEENLKKGLILDYARLAYFVSVNDLTDPLIWESYCRKYSNIQHIAGTRLIFNILTAADKGYQVGSWGYLRVSVKLVNYDLLKNYTPFDYITSFESTIPQFVHYDSVNCLKVFSDLVPSFDFSLITDKSGSHELICIGDFLKMYRGPDSEKSKSEITLFTEEVLSRTSLNPNKSNDMYDYYTLFSDGVTIMSVALNFMLNTCIAPRINSSTAAILGDTQLNLLETFQLYVSKVDTTISEEYYSFMFTIFTGLEFKSPEVPGNWKGSLRTPPDDNPGSPGSSYRPTRGGSPISPESEGSGDRPDPGPSGSGPVNPQPSAPPLEGNGQGSPNNGNPSSGTLPISVGVEGARVVTLKSVMNNCYSVLSGVNKIGGTPQVQNAAIFLLNTGIPQKVVSSGLRKLGMGNLVPRLVNQVPRQITDPRYLLPAQISIIEE